MAFKDRSRFAEDSKDVFGFHCALSVYAPCATDARAFFQLRNNTIEVFKVPHFNVNNHFSKVGRCPHH